MHIEKGQRPLAAVVDPAAGLGAVALDPAAAPDGDPAGPLVAVKSASIAIDGTVE